MDKHNLRFARNREPQEKNAIVQEIFRAGMRVSQGAWLHGVNAKQILDWHKQYK
ncbi:transposase [Serratia marcescens]|uniref:transposase n=1 Tax=Serratia marcescens TaxID=615 RepID=UPI0036FA233D